MKKSLILALALSLTVQGVSSFKVLADNENPLNISFGDQLDYQEKNGYAALSGSTYERFIQSKEELPNEVPVMHRAAVKGQNVFYVATDGSDKNSGTSVGAPFKTIEKALQAVKALSNSDKSNGSVIYLRGGEYLVSEMAEITADHCSKNAALFIAAYNGEDVTISSSESFKQNQMKKITQDSVGFASYVRLPYETRKNGYYIDYSDIGVDYISNDNEMVSGNAEMTLARYPNVGYDSVKEVINGGYGNTSVWEPMLKRAFDWLDTGNIHVYGKFAYEWEFLDSIVRIDKAKGQLHGTGSLSHWDWPLSKYLKGKGTSMYYYYNIMEELDVPGEWFADNADQKLYVYPLSDENNSYRIASTKDIFYLSNAKNVVFDGINIINTKNAIYAKDTENIIIQNCIFEGISGNAVNFVNTSRCGIINSKLSGIGTSSTMVTISDSLYERAKLVPKRNFVQNNIFDSCKYAVSLNAAGSIVSHNLIKNTSGSALFFSGAECIIEYNEFSGTQKLVGDSGAIYTGTNFYIKNNHVRYNYIHDSKYNQRNGRAIYFDDCSDDNYAYGNIVKNYGYGLQIHGGDSHVVEGNTIVNAAIPIENGYDYATNSISSNQMQWAFFVDCAILKGYTEYGFDKSENWQRRYNTKMTDKYNRVQEAKAEFASLGTETEAVKKVRDVVYYKLTHKSVPYSQIKGYSDVKKCVDVAVDTDCWYINNTLIDCVNSPVYGTAVGMDNHDSGNRILETNADEYINNISYFDKIGVVDNSGEMSKPVIHLTNGAKINPDDFRGFSWDKVNMSSYYNVEIATDSDFNNVVVDYTGDNNELSLYRYYCSSEDSEVERLSQYTYSDAQTGDDDFVADKQYYAKVTAYNNDNSISGVKSVESDIYSFVLTENTVPDNEWGMVQGNVSGYVQIEGTIPAEKTNKNVNILIYDKSASKEQLENNLSAIKHIAQTEADSKGQFSYKFKLDGNDVSNLKTVVKVGDDKLEENAFTQTVQSFTEFSIDVSKEKDVDGAEIIKAVSQANNKFGALDKYTVIIAEYAADNRFNGCRYETFNVKDVAGGETTYTVNDSTVQIKVFAWSDMVPLSKVK